MSLQQSYHPQPPSDELSRALVSGAVRVMLCLMRDAYFDLLQKHIVTQEMDENDITEEWFVCLQQRWQQSALFSFVPIHEKQDKNEAKSRGKPPTVDFCFRSEWDKHYYFGAECKLVEANDQTLCQRYIENGVNRYVDGRYGQDFPEGAMLGYIRQTCCTDVATELRNRIGALKDHPSFQHTDVLLPLEECYISRHNRPKGISPFTLYHLLFGFENKI